MEELDPINFDEASKYEIMEHILYTNAIFNVGELFCENLNFDPLSVTVITPDQMLSSIFERTQIKGGHANMTDIMLDMLYTKYKSNREPGEYLDTSIFFKNNEDNIIVVTEKDWVIVFMNKEKPITQIQFNYLNKYMSDLQKGKRILEKNKIDLYLDGATFSANDITFTEDLAKKMNEIQGKIGEKEIPMQNNVNNIDFSDCENNKGIKAKIKEYVSKLKNKANFLKGKTLNTELEEEARSVVDADVKETLIEQVSEELIDEK